jgi:GDPmannose 4,6-dehydratase
LSRINSEDRIYQHYADLRDYQSLQHIVEKVKPDYVFHLAAQSYPKTSFTSPDDTLDTNINGTSRLLEALHHCNK